MVADGTYPTLEVGTRRLLLYFKFYFTSIYSVCMMNNSTFRVIMPERNAELIVVVGYKQRCIGVPLMRSIFKVALFFR